MLARNRMKASEGVDLAEMLATTAEGGFAIDAEGRIALWNRGAEDLLGHTVREAVGRRCCELLAGDDENGNRLCCRGCHIREISKARTPVHSFDTSTASFLGHGSPDSPDGLKSGKLPNRLNMSMSHHGLKIAALAS